MPDVFMVAHRASIISAAARNNVPAVYSQSPFARDGGLLSYGVDQIDNWRRAAKLVREGGKGRIDLADRAGVQDLDLQPGGAGGFLHLPQCGLGGRNIGRIEEHGSCMSARFLATNSWPKKLIRSHCRPAERGWRQDQA
jgi:hypothetical protein